MMEMASRMSQEKFKAPNSNRRKRTVSASSFVEMSGGPPHRKKKRTSEDFLQFCTMVLSYTQYDSPTTPQSPAEMMRVEYNSSPLGSTGTADSFFSESSNMSYTSEQENNSYDYDDEDSMDLISCFCMKPYSGRPMIECNDCSVWIHLSCAKIRKTNIPDKYTCPKCRNNKSSVRKSLRTKLDEKHLIV